MMPRQGGTPSTEGWAAVKAMVRAVTLLVLGASFDIQPRPADG